VRAEAVQKFGGDLNIGTTEENFWGQCGHSRQRYSDVPLFFEIFIKMGPEIMIMGLQTFGERVLQEELPFLVDCKFPLLPLFSQGFQIGQHGIHII